MGLLRDFLPRHGYGVVGVYREESLVVEVVGLRIDDDDGLLLQFPREQPLRVGDAVTVQLDNRMDVARLSAKKPVHRTSYRGTVTEADAGTASVVPAGFQLFYSDHLVAPFPALDPGPRPDPRPVVPLVPTTRTSLDERSDAEAGSSLGVLFTRALGRPHSTVMAFLSSRDGDIFLITDPGSFKVQQLLRDPRVAFAVDFRATYDLSRPLDWSYRIQTFRALVVPRSAGLFQTVQDRFIAKSPWEGAFFSDPSSLLVHLAPEA